MFAAYLIYSLWCNWCCTGGLHDGLSAGAIFHYKHPDAAPWALASSNWLDKRGWSVNQQIMTPFEWYFCGCEEERVSQANGASLGTEAGIVTRLAGLKEAFVSWVSN